MAVWVGHHDPADLALADVDTSRSERDETVDLSLRRAVRRAYACGGLPSADWWVAGAAESADVELDAERALYDDNDLWPAAFEVGA